MPGDKEWESHVTKQNSEMFLVGHLWSVVTDTMLLYSELERCDAEEVNLAKIHVLCCHGIWSQIKC